MQQSSSSYIYSPIYIVAYIGVLKIIEADSTGMNRMYSVLAYRGREREREKERLSRPLSIELGPFLFFVFLLNFFKSVHALIVLPGLLLSVCLSVRCVFVLGTRECVSAVASARLTRVRSLYKLYSQLVPV